MPASIPAPSNDILALPQEDHIQLAMEAIAIAGYEPNSNPQLSMHRAASAFQVPRSTLRNRLNGVQPHAETHMNQQTLLPAEEEILVEWAKVMGHDGVPLTYSTITTYASEILGKVIGGLMAQEVPCLACGPQGQGDNQFREVSHKGSEREGGAVGHRSKGCHDYQL
jgi:hypothetical protein